MYENMTTITLPSKRNSDHGVSFGLWLIIGIVISIILSVGVDLDNCEYDACRFISVNAALLEFSDIAEWGNSEASTLLMHMIYGNDGSVVPGFIRTFLVNAGLMTIAVPLIGWRNPIFRSPLAFAFFVLPGKEFFLILGVGFLARAQTLAKLRHYALCIFMIVIAMFLVLLVRPGYILLGGLALALGHLWVEHRRAAFWFSLSVLYVSAIFGADYLGRSLPGGGGFEVESSIGVVSFLREYTAGIFWLQTTIRMFIYLGYLVFIPAEEIFRIGRELFTSGLMPYHIFLIAGMIEWYKWVILSANRVNIIGYAIVSAFLVAISFSFVHTRYLLPLLVLLFTFYENNFPKKKLKQI